MAMALTKMLTASVPVKREAELYLQGVRSKKILEGHSNLNEKGFQSGRMKVHEKTNLLTSEWMSVLPPNEHTAPKTKRKNA